MSTRFTAVLALTTFTLAGCLAAPTPRSSGPRRDAGADDEWSEEDPIVEEGDESGADDPTDEPPIDEPPIEEPPSDEPPTTEDEPAELFDDAELDPEDPADAAWLDEIDEESVEEGDLSEAESVGSCAARCCDGSIARDDTSEGSGQCIREAPALCEAQGFVLRTRWEGAVVYRRDRACFARCAYRSTYRRLYGVTRGCTAQARAYCEAPDRGGLADAVWSRCAPG